MSQTKKLQLIQLVWALQEFSARNCELVSIPLRGISCASGERLAALAFRLRRTLAPSALALALRARFSSRLRRSYLGQLPRIESSASRNLLRLRRKARCARLSPPADSRAFGARARASRSIFLAPPGLVFGSIA